MQPPPSEREAPDLSHAVDQGVEEAPQRERGVSDSQTTQGTEVAPQRVRGVSKGHRSSSGLAPSERERTPRDEKVNGEIEHKFKRITRSTALPQLQPTSTSERELEGEGEGEADGDEGEGNEDPSDREFCRNSKSRLAPSSWSKAVKNR